MKTLATLLIVTLFGFGAVALAGPPVKKQAAAPGKCVQAGISTLMSLGALTAAAQQDVNYAAFDNTGGTGDIATDLKEEFYAPLGVIVKLHVTNPELFSWCNQAE